MNRDERLWRSIYQTVVDGDPHAAEALERELAGRPDLLSEYRELRTLWDELASLPDPDIPAEARARARTAAFETLGGRGRSIWGFVGAAAAAVALFAGGFLAGSADTPTPGSRVGGDYALIIRGRVDPEAEEEVSTRMAAWARRLADEGRLALAERLVEDSMLWVGRRRDIDGRQPPVSGLFLVRAESLDEAQRLARAAPHLSYGGAVEILPVGRH